jgi:hypothetical protein
MMADCAIQLFNSSTSAFKRSGSYERTGTTSRKVATGSAETFFDQHFAAGSPTRQFDLQQPGRHHFKPLLLSLQARFQLNRLVPQHFPHHFYRDLFINQP